ncbi:formylmethanofuran dehydrogenase [Candidatus Fermentibacteria bacterium]|nr:MAG: formylmethanofuran dehydrogenase [Candidatus Fermentibacteria bacterium]
MNYKEILKFHGHECPGVAIGYRMASAALGALSKIRAEDEEIVAIVENDACGVDALQCLTGCTFGKGNLIFRDYGKHVYTLYSRESGKGIRVSFHDSRVPSGVRENRKEFTRWLLEAPGEEMLSLEEVAISEPPRAVIRSTVRCSICGEGVMESRIKRENGLNICIPCSLERNL